MITACEGSWPQRCSSLFASCLAASGSAASPVLLARVHVLDAIPLVVELATVLAERPFGTAGLRTNPSARHRERKGYPEGALQVVHDSPRVFRIFDDELFMRLRLDIEADLPIRRIARSL